MFRNTNTKNSIKLSRAAFYHMSASLLLVLVLISTLQLQCSNPLSVLKYCLDSLLTQYVILTATILTWRSLLTVLGHVLSDVGGSLGADVTSLLIGLVATVLLFAAEPAFAFVGARLDDVGGRWWRLVWEDVAFFVVFVGEGFLWLGAWNINATYLIADPLVGGWVNHAIGTSALFALQLFSYAGACGCSIDWMEPGETVTVDGGFYSTRYLRHFLSHRRQVGVFNSLTLVDCFCAKSRSTCRRGIVSWKYFSSKLL